MPVLFDPSLDVAVLYAPDLDAPALRFATTDPERGAEGASLGYAGGGPLVVLPAAVAGAYQATGHDIYDGALVTREIIELRAAIEPGDSGGPLVLEDGTIGRARVRGVARRSRRRLRAQPDGRGDAGRARGGPDGRGRRRGLPRLRPDGAARCPRATRAIRSAGWT